MATTSSTWRSDTFGTLVSVGVDGETIDRFSKITPSENSWEWVFSGEEIRHNNSLPAPSVGFCASFCVKEALIKAFRETFPMYLSTFTFDGCGLMQQVKLPPDLLAAHGASLALARVEAVGPDLVASVYLYNREK